MKSLQNIINEGIRKGLIEYKVNYDLNSDMYNLMEQLVDQYYMKSKDITLEDLEQAFEFFVLHCDINFDRP